ncbi:hypothetical protein [Neobacillus sp. YIM B06451]|uniref:hypothetical protein n=1 Tax=Neobacillus sp. YIM B06451 TaxID=3070994 RepID=UPI00292DDBCE|nr:hypothetical protein [Neobacillus sp. YIM B06451]
MKNKRRKSKNLLISLGILLIFLVISAFTNPTKQDYISFDERNTGVSKPESARIAQANFLLFSVYAPTLNDSVDEYGIVHLGFMGKFFQVTDGQFDKSIWERFLK